MKKIIFLLIAACFLLNLHAVQNEDQHYHYYREARKARDRKNYKKALELYAKAYSLARRPETRYHSAIEAASILIDMKDYSGAEKKLRRIISGDRMHKNHRAHATYKFGIIRLRNGDERGAENYFRKALHHRPTGETRQVILTDCAKLLYKKEKYDEANSMLKEVPGIPVHRDHQHGVVGTAKLFLARIAVKQNRLEDGNRYYSEVPHAIRSPQWAVRCAYIERINDVLFPQKKYNEVLDCLNRAEDHIHASQDRKWIPDARARAHLGKAKEAASRYNFKEAEKILQTAREVQNITDTGKKYFTNAEAYIELQRGRDMKRKKRLEQANEHFRKALAIKSPDVHIPVYLELAYLHLSQKNLKLMKQDLDSAAKVKPFNEDQKIRIWLAFADYFNNKKQYDTALTYLTKPYQEEKLSPQILADLYTKTAWVHFKLGNKDEARNFCLNVTNIPQASQGAKNTVKNILDKLSEE